MAEKQPEFVVSDRRRFGAEGELRPEAKIEEEEKPATPPAARPPAPPAQTPPVQAASTPASIPAAQKPAPPAPAQPEEEEEMPELSAEEEHQQHEAYKASGKKIDELIAAAGKGGPGPMEMSFERVVESFYMSAMIQMGALGQQEEQGARVDIIGARQTIDSLAILQEKTKGNLTDREKTLLQNVLFELRMNWIALTNAVATSAAGKPGAPSVEKK